MHTLNPNRGRTAAAYLLFALLALAIVALHTAHFSGRPYRQDEAWIVHGALEKYGVADMVQWVSVNIHPPLWMVTANTWVDLFGQDESITRFLSTLLTLVSLALLFRLAADLAGRGNYTVPLGAVFLLGTSTFFQFYAHEFRPYPALITCTLAVVLTFQRWLRRPTFRRALLFVLCGIAALYVHFFAVYVLAALVVFFIIFVRWNATRYLQAFGIFAAIGLSYVGWLLPLLHALLVTDPGGIEYGIPSTGEMLTTILRNISFRPYELVVFLLITSVLLSLRLITRKGRAPHPSPQLFRWGSLWRKAYPLVIGVTILLLAYLVNSVIANLTQRSLVILLPLAALFLAFGLAALPRAAQVALVFLFVPSAFTFVDYAYPGPQREVAAYVSQEYQAGSPIILNVPYVPNQVAVLYYVQNRLNAPVAHDLIWQVITLNQPYVDFLPYTPRHLMSGTDSAAVADLERFLNTADSDQVWYIERGDGTYFTDSIREVLEEQYTVFRRQRWEGEYTAFQYRRKVTAPDYSALTLLPVSP